MEIDFPKDVGKITCHNDIFQSNQQIFAFLN